MDEQQFDDLIRSLTHAAGASRRGLLGGLLALLPLSLAGEHTDAKRKGKGKKKRKKRRCQPKCATNNPCGDDGCGESCGECDTLEVCQAGQCVSSCQDGFQPCGNECVDTQNDPDHCGDCTTECQGDLVCLSGTCGCAAGTECGTRCVNAQTNPDHCGTCGHECQQEDPSTCGETGQCVGGVCQTHGTQTVCRTPSCIGLTLRLAATCDGNGSCPPATQVSCDDSVACTDDACDAASGACTHTPNDARCTGNQICHPQQGCRCEDGQFDLQTDVDNCGACGNKCQFAHATAVCNQGSCQLDECDPGWADCDGTGGCETQLGTLTTCRTCTEICDPSRVCHPQEGCLCPTNRPIPCGPACIQVGEVCTTGLPGVCGTGTRQCVDNEPTCVPDILPDTQQEVCDGLDNDCDGVVDEGTCPGLASGPRECRFSERIGGYHCCSPPGNICGPAWPPCCSDSCVYAGAAGYFQYLCE